MLAQKEIQLFLWVLFVPSSKQGREGGRSSCWGQGKVIPKQGVLAPPFFGIRICFLNTRDLFFYRMPSCRGVYRKWGPLFCPKIALGSHSEQNILNCTSPRASADPSQPQLKLGMFVMLGIKERMVCGFLKPPFDPGVKSTPCTIEWSIINAKRNPHSGEFKTIPKLKLACMKYSLKNSKWLTNQAKKNKIKKKKRISFIFYFWFSSN